MSIKKEKNESDTYAKTKNFKHNDIKIAFICDEMTWCDYKDCFKSIFIRPFIWKKQFDDFKPDILFCESAWSGIDKYKNCWKGRIYKDGRILFENRKELLDILQYCNYNNIKTVFWNKEDPTYFHNTTYNFVSTGLLFDYLFTTAEECIDEYKNLGHKNVQVMPFGVNTKIFSSNDYKPQKNTAVFAGSWFSDQPERCRSLENLLDYAISQGWKLDIYDRKSGCTEERFRFPKKYHKYIRPSVKYSSIPEIYKRYEYAINVSTVTNSNTMFSRRVLHLIASGNNIVSNLFDGLNKLDNYIKIIDKPADNIVIFKGNMQKISDSLLVQNQFEFIKKKVLEENSDKGLTKIEAV